MSDSPETKTSAGAVGPAISEPSGPRLPYLPALDGLRALAVIAVLLYHANMVWIPGGFLGVEMFFVISGYLITSLLLADWDQRGRVDFQGFWLRRARRLFPALFLLLLVVGGGVVLFLPAEAATLRGDAFSAAGYVNNWYQILSHKSYFETVGRPSLFRHLWSLAVEEQFYLVWPLLFSLLMSRLRRQHVLPVVLAGALAAMLLMAMLFRPDTDPSRVYYGTDTRAAGLLLGVALAYLWPPGRQSLEAPSWALDGVGVAAFGTLLACFALLNEFQAFLYRGGFSLTGLVTAELVAVAVHPRARWVPRVLSWAPLRWIGIRSYGIYLWHFPVFMLTRPQLDVPLDGLWLLLARFALTLGIAALSYRWVETPIRNGLLGRWWRTWRQAEGEQRRRLGLGWALGALSVLAAFGVLGVGLAMAPAPRPPAYLVAATREANPAVDASPLLAIPSPPTGARDLLSPLSLLQSGLPGDSVGTNVRVDGIDAPPATNVGPSLRAIMQAGVTAIGDSVLEGVAEELKRVLGTNLIMDADQGRLPWHTAEVVRALHARGKINPTVILHIGNNGFFSSEAFEEIMAELKQTRRVVVVNLKVPRRWESLNNKMLAQEIKAYPNAVLVDWRGASGDQPKIFWNDGIHLRPAGARVFAALILRAVRD